MLKDIDFKKVTDLAMAVTPPKTENDADDWRVHLLNLKEETITDVMVSSKGYGEVEGKEVKTSSLRQYIDQIEPGEYVTLEIITDELKHISNQFWVSFYCNGELFDKKYVFVKESISTEFFTEIPLLETQGVMIR